MNPPDPGWYRDPYFKNRERYWDGEIWTDECRIVQPALPSATPGRHATQAAAAADAAAAAATAAAKRPPMPMPPARPGSPFPPVVPPRPAVPGDITQAQPAVPNDITKAQPAVPDDITAAHPVVPEDITAAQAAVTADPITTQQPAVTADDVPSSTEPIKIDSRDAAAAAAGAAAVSRADAGPADAASILGTEQPAAGDRPPTRNIKTPKEPPPEATRRLRQEPDPLLGVSMPGSNAAAASLATEAEADKAKTHRRGVLVAVLAVVVVLAGLGAYLVIDHHGGKTKKGGKDGSSGPVAAAAKASLHQKSVHVTLDVQLQASNLGLTQGLSGQGDFDLSKNSGSVTLTVPGATGPTTRQIIYIDKTVYVNLGTQLSSVIPGKTWVSTDVLGVASAGASVGSTTASFEQLVGNPSALMRQLRGTSAKVVPLGSSVFDGTPVTGYAVILSNKEIHHNIELVPSSHTRENVYVDSNGLIKAIVIPTTVVTGTQSFKETTTITFSNYGAPVTIAPPPASETVPIAQFAAASNGASGTG